MLVGQINKAIPKVQIKPSKRTNKSWNGAGILKEFEHWERKQSFFSRRKAEAPFYGSSETKVIRPLSNKMTLGKGLEEMAGSERGAWGQEATEAAGLGQCQHSNTVWRTIIYKNISPVNTDLSWLHSWVAPWNKAPWWWPFKPLWAPHLVRP